IPTPIPTPTSTTIPTAIPTSTTIPTATATPIPTAIPTSTPTATASSTTAEFCADATSLCRSNQEKKEDTYWLNCWACSADSSSNWRYCLAYTPNDATGRAYLPNYASCYNTGTPK